MSLAILFAIFMEGGWEGEVIQELDSNIRKLARGWSRDCPDAWEDLAQEARLGIYQELKEKPDSPRHHLFRRAKHEILDYRKRGKSVDGKLDKTYKREQVWDLASLDANPRGILAANSSLYFRPHQLRPVEDTALARVSYGELRGSLTEMEDQYLSLRLQGYNNTEASTLLGLTLYRVRWLREEIKRKARKVFFAAEDGQTTRSP